MVNISSLSVIVSLINKKIKREKKLNLIFRKEYFNVLFFCFVIPGFVGSLRKLF